MFDRCYSSHRSLKNKLGIVGVGYFERWRRSISVKEISEYSVGFLTPSLGGQAAAEKEVITISCPQLFLLPPQLHVTLSTFQCLKKREEK